jgi:hypothetical protein
MRPRKGEFMAGPTFVCTFADGTVTRMSAYCAKGLDLARAIKVAHAAYESRRKKAPPGIFGCRFEDPLSGVVLKEYDAAAIEAATAS